MPLSRFGVSALSALSALVLAAGAVACSGAASTITPVVVNAGSTLTFTPVELQATRSPKVCGVASPPYVDGDLFVLDATGAGAGNPASGVPTAIDLTFPTPLAAQAASELLLAPAVTIPNPAGAYRSQSATASGSYIGFTFQWGTDPNEIDPSTLHKVDVTILAIPQRDGDPLTVRYVIQFDDGKTLDETFSAPVSTTVNGCAAG